MNENFGKYYVHVSEDSVVFKIKYVTIQDSGFYTVKVNSGIEEKTLKLQLTAYDPPEFLMQATFLPELLTNYWEQEEK